MQLKIIVETEEEFNKWMSEQGTFAETVMVEDDATTQAFNVVDAAQPAVEEVSSED